MEPSNSSRAVSPWDGALPEPIEVMQAKLCEVFALRSLPVDEEVRMREDMAKLLQAQFNCSHNPQHLRDAIQHLEMIVRRLPGPSAERARLLNELSYNKMSEYGLTNARRTIDESIALARQAAVEAPLVEYPHLKRKILHNLGYSLSYRYVLTNDKADVDEAIECGRTVLRLTLSTDETHQATVTNLSSRLHNRFLRYGNTADKDEAMKLTNGQLAAFPLGSPQHGAALVLLGSVAFSNYYRTNNRDDLEEALKYHVAGLSSMSQSENHALILSRVSALHKARYKHTGDFSDLQSAVKYSAQAIEAAPPSSQVRYKYLSDHMTLLKQSVKNTTSMSDVEDAIQQSSRLLPTLPANYPQIYMCRCFHGDLLSRQYILSRDLGHLVDAVSYASKLSSDYNDFIKTDNKAERQVDSRSLWDLSTSVSKIQRAIPKSAAKQHAADKLYQWFSSQYELDLHNENIMFSLWDVQKNHGSELKRYADALENGNALTVGELEKTLNEIKHISKDPTTSQDLPSARDPKKKRLHEGGDFKTMFGQRTLQTDKATGRMVMEIVVSSIYGYDEDDEGPLTREKFVAREARLESETLEAEKRENKNPNTELCRICRRMKPLIQTTLSSQPKWNEEVRWMPFGNWNQLACRTHCSICRLIFSLITDGSLNNLHPRLAMIDYEVQGISLHPGKGSTSEDVLGVDYGMRRVGALRIISPNNQKEVLRPDNLDYIMIRRWLNNCDQNHGQFCVADPGGTGYVAGLLPSEQAQETTAMPLVFIDVMDKKLIPLPLDTTYFALSYVWGKVKMPVTLRSNYMSRLETGALSEAAIGKLPQTIHDAMTLVDQLGYRYLWVDSLCIVQDDAENKHRDIKRMNIVYSKAFATIVAMHGSDANAGLPGVRAGTRRQQLMRHVAPYAPSDDYDVQNRKGKNLEVQLLNPKKAVIVASPTTLHQAVDASKWDSRGWIFQEKLLSRRRIYFSSDFVYVQCNREVLCETKLDQTPKGSVPAVPEQDNPLVELKDLPERRDVCVQKIIQVYQNLVGMYTARELSYSSDILDAFSGLLAILNKYFDGPILSGLPAAALDLALLWTPATPNCRRDFETTKSREQAFPSWTWAAWDGQAEHRLQLEGESPPVPAADEYQIYHLGRLQRIRKRLSGTDPRTHEAVERVQEGTYCPSLGPNVLQFWAETASMSAFTTRTNPHGVDVLSSRDHVHSSGQQRVLQLLDSCGRHCGIWFKVQLRLPRGEHRGFSYTREGDPRWDLVAVSNYGDVYQARRGPNRVEGEIKLFDADEFFMVGRDSGLVNVLVIEWFHEVAERVTVAQVHAQAWKAARPQRKHIRLA